MASSKSSPLIYLLFIIISISIVYIKSSSPIYSVFSGYTMGTTYEIKIPYKISNIDRTIIETGIDSILFEINDIMSTYIDTSEVSYLNNNIGQLENDYFTISSKMYFILDQSIYFNELTGGAFDITINPLLSLWGFRGNEPISKPSQDVILKMMKYIGTDKINISYKEESNNRRYFYSKSHPLVSLDLGAIAKGYAVDMISKVISQLGYDNHYIEIGGEIICKGSNKDDEKWLVSIAFPEFGSSRPFLDISISGHAIATSGTYNQNIVLEGIQYNHIFDPRTGMPALNNIVSVTVISDKCYISDALTTSLKVLGVNDGLTLIEKLSNAECMFLLKGEDGIEKYFSSGFSNFIIN